MGNIDGVASSRANIIRPACMNFQKMSLLESSKLSFMYVLLELRFFDNIPISGLHCIIDLEGVTKEHMINGTPANFKKLVAMQVKNTPCLIIVSEVGNSKCSAMNKLHIK